MPHDEAERAMWSLPFYERAAMLIGSMIEEDGDGLRFIARLAVLMHYLAGQLSELHKRACCKLLRDVADRLEAGLEVGEEPRVIH
ncbi:hypothetical protein [Bradyrhizobium sp. WYCCWR 12699]|uniref:hypothetical protein n=1 Tax=Bradyrhizobium sp. WYCCWR 12699 TaxID=3064203 RepID=UPI0028A425CC|nr:hypothetical protein [Bradyrhizobium sp. WYCCWR 12699]MDT4739251.1 hypothetical protein [Bradyrhizobium sp. WYCCWR 12699]